MKKHYVNPIVDLEKITIDNVLHVSGDESFKDAGDIFE